MALRILGFKFDDVSLKMKTKVAKMYEFLLTSYKGVPCAFCDAKNHLFLNSGEQKIIQSNHFCRATVQHSLIPLLYLHKHYRDFHNIATMFVNQCDTEGNFNAEVEVPATSKMNYNEENLRHVISCRDSRNYPSWISACESICNKVHPLKLENFFFPDLDIISGVTKELKKSIEAFIGGPEPEKKEDTNQKAGSPKEGEEKKPEEKKKEEEKTEASSKSGRILSRLHHHHRRRHSRVLKDTAETQPQKPTETAEKPKEGTESATKTDAKANENKEPSAEKKEGPPEPKTPEEKITLYGNSAIFLIQNENSKEIQNFKIEFSEFGIDPYENGEFIDLSEELYKANSALAKPETASSPTNKPASPDGKESDSKENESNEAKPAADKKAETPDAKEGETKAASMATRALKSASIFEKSFMVFMVILISVWNL